MVQTPWLHLFNKQSVQRTCFSCMKFIELLVLSIFIHRTEIYVSYKENLFCCMKLIEYLISLVLSILRSDTFM